MEMHSRTRTGPAHDDAVAVFGPGQSEDARGWLEDYGWSRAPNFEAAMEKIKNALLAREPR